MDKWCKCCAEKLILIDHNLYECEYCNGILDLESGEYE